MNLFKLVNQLAAETDWEFFFDESVCLHSLDKFSACEACFGICPAGAIWPEKPPEFDQEACQHCRACLAVCPFGAYTYSGIDAVQALLNLLEQQKVATCDLFCQLNPNLDASCPGSEAGIRVPGCLAGMGTGGYLAVLSRGVKKAFVRTDACVGCPWGDLVSQIEQQVDQAQQWLAIWGRADDLVYPEPNLVEAREQWPVWNAGSPPRSRRDLFRLPKDNGEQEADIGLGEIHGHHLFRERLRVVKAVQQLSSQGAESMTETSLDGLSFAMLSVSEACTACGTCARACPTGALEFEITSDSYVLTLTPEACLGCDLCKHVCAPGAISLNHAPTFGEIFGTQSDILLQEGALTHCERCHAAFAAKPGQRLCPVCEFRHKNPFGTTLPPGLLHNLKKEKHPE